MISSKNGMKISQSTSGSDGTATAVNLVSIKPKRKWQSYIWDTFDKSPEERTFLFKLDGILLTLASLGYFIKYLDQTNINNAFVSGMQKDLALYGNELNYMQTAWTVGYVIGEIPSNIILSRVRPSIWIPTLQVIWTVLTFGLSRCNHAYQIYAVRFFVGLVEGGFYPGMQYIIGSWYRSDELAKRSCIFHTSSSIATMFSGYLMAAVYKLNGVQGYRGWQWLFIVDGIISLPIALAGFFLLPDMPDTTRARYLSVTDRALAVRRMELEGRKKRAPYTKAKIKKILTSWHIWALTILYILFNNGGTGSVPVFAQFLKASKNPVYTVAQINVYPTCTNAVAIASTLLYAWTSDGLFNGRRWPAVVFGASMNVFCCTALAIWHIPEGLRWFSYIASGTGYGLSGLLFAWAHEICADDNEERAIVTATMNEMAYVFQAWLPLLVWQQVTAPEYRKGFITASCLSTLLVITTFVTKALWQREKLQKVQPTGYESDVASDVASDATQSLQVEVITLGKSD